MTERQPRDKREMTNFYILENFSNFARRKRADNKEINYTT